MCRECKVGILRGGCSLSKCTVGSQQMCRQSMCVLPWMCTWACLCGNTLGFGMFPGMNTDNPLVYASEMHVYLFVYMWGSVQVCVFMCTYVWVGRVCIRGCIGMGACIYVRIVYMSMRVYVYGYVCEGSVYVCEHDLVWHNSTWVSPSVLLFILCFELLSHSSSLKPYLELVHLWAPGLFSGRRYSISTV